MNSGTSSCSSHLFARHGHDFAILAGERHLRSTIITEPKVFEPPDGFSCARICCRILVGASLGFYAEELALMEIKKSSAALRIGAFGKHVASHARRRSLRDVGSLLRFREKLGISGSESCGNRGLIPYRDRVLDCDFVAGDPSTLRSRLSNLLPHLTRAERGLRGFGQITRTIPRS